MTYVLIPGAGGAAYVWHRVEAELRARGHDAIAVQLPADDDEAGLADYADIVVAAAGAADDVVLAAQSMGAYSAALAARRLPVSTIVLVNPMIPLPGETAGEWWEATGHDEAIRESDRREGGPADGTFDDRFFPADFQRRLARERLGIVPVELPGGHLLPLVRPAEVAGLLDAG